MTRKVLIHPPPTSSHTTPSYLCIHQMSSDYEFSDDDADYYDDEEMLDGTQDEEGWLFLLVVSGIDLLFFC